MELKTNIIGHVRAVWKDTGEVVLDKFNAIHKKNMAIALARGLANENNHQIFKMVFGNGGTYIESGATSAQYHYLSPNVEDDNANLYNPTYQELIDDAAAGASNGNQVVSAIGSTPNTTLVICTCTLSSIEPNGQNQTDGGDTVTDINDDGTYTDSVYYFDEMGLKTADGWTTGDDLTDAASFDDGLLLSHLIFSPIEKTANRELIITYTLTITVS